ncbi:hypothetical protein ASG25_10890 [Rhizobium sp. Leaf384]|nr:hypothetical protein ASG25_10890 [Rhizobium sp. Leaf384]
MKLTWNQKTALGILAHASASGLPMGQIRESGWGLMPYLCGSAGRAATLSLCEKGLAECCFEGKPKRYRATDAGRATLQEKEAGE